MKLKLLVLAALLGVFAVAPSPAAAAPSTQTCTDPVQTALSGTFTDAAGTVYSYTACATLKSVNAADGGTATLRVVGTVTNTATGAVTTFTQNVTAPVTATGTCTILDLTIGPIDLNLLGLVVHTDTIHLEITAQQGPGNLLGNLLCAIAGLLDGSGGSLTNQIANLINQVLAILSTR
jgi:hypothetical protein